MNDTKFLKESDQSINSNRKSKETNNSHSKMTTSDVSHVRIIQNFCLAWLDSNINHGNNKDSINTITQLRRIVNTIKTFTAIEECMEFIENIRDEKIFMISSGTLGQTIVPVIHDMTQVDSIYIFCSYKARYEQWAKTWSKIKGVFTDITRICQALKQATVDYDQNSLSISLVTTTDDSRTQNLDELDKSFMYTQILKEILLTIDFNQDYINEFILYCREQFIDNTFELKHVDKLEKEYRSYQAIWWYSYDCFLYSMVNCALRKMDVDLITKMGFFVRDLHNHIGALHSEQYGEQDATDTFIVYRGQGLSSMDFEQVMQTKGGLLSFNNFLSTSKIRNVSLDFARRSMANHNLIGVLFVITVNPSIVCTPFANVSAYKTEEEILFSMHSIFRIEQIKKIDENDRLWQINLNLTGDSDPQLHALTERLREETKGTTGWFRLGKLMVKLAHYDKAEHLYNILLTQTIEERDRGDIYYQLGCIMLGRGEYSNAILFYEKSLQLREKILTSEHPDIAECYNDLGIVYDNMDESLKALSYYEKAIKIWQKTLPSNHPDLATCYNNMGGAYDKIGEYSKGLSFHEQALQIRQKTLPLNHPDFAVSYSNIASVYDNMDEYSKALSYYEKTLEIRQRTLPPNHPDFATSYNNIAMVYNNMSEYTKALSYFEDASKILQYSLPSDHPHVQSVKENIIYVKTMLQITNPVEISSSST